MLLFPAVASAKTKTPPKTETIFFLGTAKGDSQTAVSFWVKGR